MLGTSLEQQSIHPSQPNGSRQREPFEAGVIDITHLYYGLPDDENLTLAVKEARSRFGSLSFVSLEQVKEIVWAFLGSFPDIRFIVDYNCQQDSATLLGIGSLEAIPNGTGKLLSRSKGNQIYFFELAPDYKNQQRLELLYSLNYSDDGLNDYSIAGETLYYMMTKLRTLPYDYYLRILNEAFTHMWEKEPIRMIGDEIRRTNARFWTEEVEKVLFLGFEINFSEKREIIHLGFSKPEDLRSDTVLHNAYYNVANYLEIHPTNKIAQELLLRIINLGCVFSNAKSNILTDVIVYNWDKTIKGLSLIAHHSLPTVESSLMYSAFLNLISKIKKIGLTDQKLIDKFRAEFKSAHIGSELWSLIDRKLTSHEINVIAKSLVDAFASRYTDEPVDFFKE